MPQLTPGDGQDLLERVKRAWEKRDVDLAMSLFGPDAEFRYDPFEPALTGENAIREYWNDAAATHANVEFDAERVWVSGMTVLSSFHAAFTRRSTAERVRYRGFMTFELDEARLVSRFKEWVIVRTVGVDSSHTREHAHPEPVHPEHVHVGEGSDGG